jgi:hypothetical protein
MALILSRCLPLMGMQASPQAAEQSPEQLQQLVAPIALYPGGLIGQILPAATHPAHLVDASKWLQQHGDLTGDQLAKEVDKQPWDASVKALTQFPAVLANTRGSTWMMWAMTGAHLGLA